MSLVCPFELKLLDGADRILDGFAQRFGNQSFEARLQVLEAASSRLGGFMLADYQKAFGVAPLATSVALLECGRKLLDELEETGIHPSLALSALAREPLKESDQRATGAYHTDFRLASHLATLADFSFRENARVIDPACGTGILLVALTLAVCGSDRARTAHWLSNCVLAADLSDRSLRGALLALAALTEDMGALRRMRSNWRCHDSLLAPMDEWNLIAPGGFDVVIGNPPWEKIKLTRHEFLKASGQERHYGGSYYDLDHAAFSRGRADVADYAKTLANRYPLLGSGEPDLYMAFVELFTRLVRPGGKITVLVPAGLIRSQGTEPLRKHIFKSYDQVSISVLENRARFFSIDTRFKFLAISCSKADPAVKARPEPISLFHEKGTETGVQRFGNARLERPSLVLVRPDLTIPEVRSNQEWKMFLSMSKQGVQRDDPKAAWEPEIVREVDMTRERSYFKDKPAPGFLPLVEGRMVQQHRFGAKGYVSGSGRRAVWRANPIGRSLLAPQFWIGEQPLAVRVRGRVRMLRAGFCDITGQTNERSMMAAIIPPGVACGNKVPTVTFPNDPSEERLLLWVAIANSLPFDWFLRRIVTTTVNYFLLLSTPLPKIRKDCLPGRQMISAARDLRKLDSTACSKVELWKIAELRVKIDLGCLVGYGLGYDDLSVMLDDFPLLDRGQPPLSSEQQSTVTRDFLLWAAAKRFKRPQECLKERVLSAKSLGAIPYIPSEISMGEDRGEEAYRA